MRRDINLPLVIAAFVTTLTLAMVGCLFWVAQSYSVGTDSALGDASGIYLLTAKDSYDLQLNGAIMLTQTDRVVSAEDVLGYFSQTLAEQLPLVAAVFALLVAGCGFALHWVLKTDQKARSLAVVAQLKALPNDPTIIDTDPVLAPAYRQLEAIFAEHLEDQERMHSYLAHEQKNAIAILRADGLFDDHPTQARLLDELADGIDDVLTLSESRTETAQAAVDVAMVAAKACESYQGLAKIDFDFDEDANLETAANRRWIYRAIANLLDNAVKYAPGSPISVDICNQHDTVIVRVRDHGPGMSADDLEKIFNHRYRMNQLRSDGYGIGLSLVWHVCNLTGGFAYVDSEPGLGTEFTLSFPQFDPNAQFDI
ncbi:MAG: HAMP domain-containing histidine kinase [Propionibacteriaceae bacterium]|nr:HAMP domain-containing histidine kinase [Propionibacteriaceae bacterium]